ncbi:hypothetical protein NHI66_003675 [Clostridium botulinum]|nr:hypothetical protein [Clostridium botulinum]EJP6474262.1 hypothetical protein [Clostridium botulinum]
MVGLKDSIIETDIYFQNKIRPNVINVNNVIERYCYGNDKDYRAELKKAIDNKESKSKTF